MSGNAEDFKDLAPLSTEARIGIDKMGTLGDFLTLVSKNAIEAAIAAQRGRDNLETHGPAYHAHGGSLEARLANIWNGQPNSIDPRKI